MEMDKSNFNVIKNGKQYQARILANFVIYGEHYCIYTISHLDNYDVYCAKVVDDALIDVQDEKEKEIVSNVILKLVNAIK